MEAAKDAWLEAHPEYKPENDPNDEKWGALSKTVGSFFKSPQNPKDVTKILDAAHKMVNPHAERALPVKPRASVAAAQEKVSVSSKSSGGSGVSTKGAAPKRSSGVTANMYEGFTDDELREMGII